MLALGGASLCLALSSGCSRTRTLTTIEAVRLAPPAALLRACPRPDLRGATNAALLEHVLDLSAALGECNADKAALRKWAGEN